MKKSLLLALMLFANMAQAHVGHEQASLMDGLMHPYGFDHFLAMVTVGLWSARTFKGWSRFYAPVIFVTTLMLGAVLAHDSGIEFASAETLIAVSVVAFGALIIFTQIPNTLGLALIAAAGLVHGWAHGLEATAGGVFVLYVSGFVFSTAALHWVGVLVGSRLLHARVWLWHCLGLAMGVFGTYVLASI